MIDFLANKLAVAGALILVLSIILLVYLWFLLPERIKSTKDEQSPAVSAARDLPALHSLTSADLSFIDETKDETKRKQRLAEFEHRLLSREVKKGDELTTAMLVTPEATALLHDTLQAPIPANLNTTLGGSLKVGDIVQIVWFSGAKPTEQGEPSFIEDLVVVSVPTGNLPEATAPAPTEQPKPVTSPATKSAAPAQPATTAQPAAPAQAAAVAKDDKTSASASAVIVLALSRDKIKNLDLAMRSGKWMLVRKSLLVAGKKDVAQVK
ncbi:MAG TPA: hypothetical protein VF527_19060 [Pyrinomonadaceae bacterium]|jgi:hypothetical protein